MNPEEFASLLDLIDDSYFTVIEALAILGLKPRESHLEVEDRLLVAGLETCDACGKWVSSGEIQEDGEEGLCPECYEESC